MRTLLLAGAAALTLTALPTVLSAQNGGPEAAAAADFTMTAEQQATFDAWPADRQTYYTDLDAEHQAYFWSLTPRQMEGYWVLTPEQRMQVFAMTPTARASAWTSIEAQLAANANNSGTSVAARTGGAVPGPQTTAQANVRATPGPATTTVATNASGQTVVATNHPGNLTPPPAQALNKTYPICSRAVQDSCQNPGEGGAPGRSRALGYWPGEPASERTDRGG
ncbi:MAG TPA: hypothetical protein VEB68_05325 [Croceibacterium sp.]|nr:hypothetical protein [Croceibacterium sp.]